MINDYRAMCAELLAAYKQCLYAQGNYEQWLLGSMLADRADKLLDQPEPQPPTAGEVVELQRWGVDHGAQPGRPLLYPMDDGYWTPWHIAADLLQRQAEWKASALAVERKWDANGIATMLGCQLGESQRACIQREVPRLLDRLRELEHPHPVAVSERLPEPSVKVLAHYFNALGKGRTICAIWVPAKSRSDEGDLDADDFLEYDEDGDKYYWPEGWYEAIENWEELGWAKVYEGEIAYWQPLPQWPANALPTPEANAQ